MHPFVLCACRHFKCEWQDLGALSVAEQDGALRGWSIAPEGVVTDFESAHYGKTVLSLAHVRKCAIEPKIIVYYTQSRNMGVLPRRSFKIKNDITFRWSRLTRLMRMDWVCFPIHGQDYCAFDVKHAQTFPVDMINGTTAAYLDSVRVEQKGSITARDLHDLSTTDLPVHDDPEGNTVFLAFAATCMAELKQIQSYLDLNVEPLGTGRAIQVCRSTIVSKRCVYACVYIHNICKYNYVQAKIAQYQRTILQNTFTEYKAMLGDEFCSVCNDTDLWNQWRRQLETMLPGRTLHKSIVADFKALQLRFPTRSFRASLSPSPAKKMRQDREQEARDTARVTPPSPIVPGYTKTCSKLDFKRLDKKFNQVIDNMQELVSIVCIKRDARKRVARPLRLTSATVSCSSAPVIV